MKKILSILTLTLSLFITACTDSPKYDFSSHESINASFVAQGAKEGFNEEETHKIFHRYQKYIGHKHFEETGENGGNMKEEVIVKYTQGVTFTEMKKIGDEFYEVREDPAKLKEMLKKNK